MNIIVPIHVTALRVSPSTTETVKSALYDFSVCGTSPLSSEANLVAADQLLSAEVDVGREPGIHLQWSVPSAYTRGIQSNVDGSLAFPGLPNRWLVTRFLTMQGATSTAMWMLEADAHAAESTNVAGAVTTMPWMADPTDLFGLTFHYIGRRVALTTSPATPWTETAATPPAGGVAYLGPQLQAPLAYGETFTAYYRHCRNLFGMYDDLKDVFSDANALEATCQFSVSYSVIGWVAPQANDAAVVMLTQAVSAYNQLPSDTRPAFADYIQQSIESELQWTLASCAAFTPDDAATTQAVLSGVVTGIDWQITSPGNPSYPSALPDGSGVAVAIGNNNAEALSAYLNAVDQGTATSDPGDVTSNLEWLLNALQFNQLQNLGNGELGVGQLDRYLHARSFGSRPGGYLWSMRQPMAPNAAPTLQAQEVTRPLPLARLLSQLNQAQQQYDAVSAEIFTRQQKLFFDWGFHVNAIETNVVGHQQPIADDTSGAYLLDGLLHLFAPMATSGASGNIAPQRGPYAYVPSAFSIQVPTAIDSHLPNYVFNQTANATAASMSAALLDLCYTLAATVPAAVATLMAQVGSARQSLTVAQAGGATAASYVQPAVTALQDAQQSAETLVSMSATVTPASGGLGSIKSSIDTEIQALDTMTAPATGVFATYLPVSSTLAVPASPGTTYTGTMASYQDFVNAGSWEANAPGASAGFGGMGDLIDRLTGQGAYPPPAFDTQVAGVCLATAYCWCVSGQTAVNAAAYYVQLAQQEVGNAQAAAQSASDALQQALAAVAGAGAVADLGNAIAQLPGTLSAALAQLTSETPDPAGALTTLQSVPDFAALVDSADWTAFTASIETAWTAVQGRLPLAHQTSILSTCLAAQVLGQYELATVPATPYWQPNEPVLLLAEPSGQGNLIRSVNVATPVPCRLDGDTLQPTGAIAWPSAVTAIPSLVNPQIPSLSTVLQRLVEEAYLLDQQTAPDQMSGTPPSAIAVNAWSGGDGFQPLFILWQAEYLYSQRVQASGDVVPGDYLGDFVLDDYLVGYQPSSANEFQLNASAPNSLGLHGVIPLSSSSTANLCGQIVSYCTSTFGFDPSQGAPSTSAENYGELKLLYDAYNGFQAGSILSQGLSGLNAGLRQRVQELQLPLNIPQAWTATDGSNIPATSFWPTQFLFNQSATWPAAWSSDAIDVSGLGAGQSTITFQPLRAGFMRVTSVTLVDVFGRFVNLPAPSLVIAETLQSAVPAPADHPVYLPPRLVQPSRVMAQWLSASAPDALEPFTEWNPHPAASPICGWLLPNHLDQSLMLYDADGTPLGSLGAAGSQLRWFAPPGQAYDAGEDNRTQLLDNLTSQDANPALQAFVSAFAYPADGTDVLGNFGKFLGVADDAQQSIVTKSMQQDQALAVLVGQPLVLARLSIALQLQGLPDVSLDSGTYMPWNGGTSTRFQLDDTGYVPYDFANFDDGGITALQVPIRIGAVAYEKQGAVTPYFDDGVVGFFLDDDYTVFYTPVSVTDEYQIKSTAPPNAAAAAVMPDGTPITITLVLDPRAPVNLTTGVLPVAPLSIPPDQYSAALNRLLVTFLTAPVLQNGDGFTLPVPSEPGYEWAWWQIGQSADQPVSAAQINTDAVFPDTPQTIVDGWLKLTEGS